MTSTAQKREKGIYRRDDKKVGQGYQALILYKGQREAKYFSDSRWGGMTQARQAAINWRNEREKSLGILRTNRRLVTQTSRSSTGIVGISRAKNGYKVSLQTCISITPQRSAKKALAEAIRLRRLIQEIFAEID
jgi:hypothetical protein